tara:strand:- start:891 stop:1358 length:468 start_codon:yes stop_codon:yes gene_type:complete
MSIHVNVVLIYRHGFFTEDVKKVRAWLKSLNPNYSPSFTALIESHESIVSFNSEHALAVLNEHTGEMSSYIGGQHLYVVNAATKKQKEAIANALKTDPSHAGAVINLHKQGDLQDVETPGLMCIDFRSEPGISRCPEYHYLTKNGEVKVFDNIQA